MVFAGVSKETTRMILPLGTQTTMYMNGSIRSWVNYIDLRTAEDTQKEHQETQKLLKKKYLLIIFQL